MIEENKACKTQSTVKLHLRVLLTMTTAKPSYQDLWSAVVVPWMAESRRKARSIRLPHCHSRLRHQVDSRGQEVLQHHCRLCRGENFLLLKALN